MKKKDLRKQYLSKRLELSEEDRIIMNEKMLDQFLQIKLPELNHVMSYIAIAEKHEVVPTAIEIWLKQQHPESLLCYPKTDLNVFSMEAVTHTEGMAIANNELGVAEPVTGENIDPQEIDLIIVPLVAFDERGYRVGYGKGFYDRFISRCHPGVITIGLSFFEAAEPIEDAAEYDVPLKYSVTPEKLYTF
jgi:5-formyltetrahydrofolate cyclo-ligase